jgi:hypothetical protein
MTNKSALVLALAFTASLSACKETPATKVKMTWFGIANWTVEVGPLNVLLDGYMSRIPEDYFAGGGGGLGLTKAAFPIDRGMVDKMHGVLRASNPINYLLTGHSHFDHSFDTPYWAKITGAKVIGSQSTCYQTQALGVPADQCSAVYGGEVFKLSEDVTMYVVLWNHSGTHEQNGEQHDPVELRAPPVPDANGNLRGGVAEDFPNGGGNRGYLFVIKRKDGRHPLSIFWTNSGSPTDLHLDTIIDGKNYGSPLQSLAKAMHAEHLTEVDIWIAGGGEPVARWVVPVLRPRVYIPNHLGDFYHPFADGYDNGPFRDAGLKRFLDTAGIQMISPVQYMDRYEMNGLGTWAVPNPEGRGPFGLPEIPVIKDAGTDAANDATGDAVATDAPAEAGDNDAAEAGTDDAADGGTGDADGPTDGTPELDAPRDASDAADGRRDGRG